MIGAAGFSCPNPKGLNSQGLAPLPHQTTPQRMDIIFLQGLTIETVIGIYDWERDIRQTVVLDLEMAADIRKSAESNDIGHTVDYNAVSRRIIQFVEDSQFELVETLAERITQLLMEEFAIPWIRLRLNKRGAIRGATDVGILIERGRRESLP